MILMAITRKLRLYDIKAVGREKITELYKLHSRIGHLSIPEASLKVKPPYWLLL